MGHAESNATARGILGRPTRQTTVAQIPSMSLEQVQHPWVYDTDIAGNGRGHYRGDICGRDTAFQLAGMGRLSKRLNNMTLDDAHIGYMGPLRR